MGYRRDGSRKRTALDDADYLTVLFGDRSANVCLELEFDDQTTNLLERDDPASIGAKVRKPLPVDLVREGLDSLGIRETGWPNRDHLADNSQATRPRAPQPTS
jgi:hypothetical protein